MSDLQQRIEELEKEAAEKEQFAKLAISRDARHYYENTATHLRNEAEKIRQRISLVAQPIGDKGQAAHRRLLSQ